MDLGRLTHKTISEDLLLSLTENKKSVIDQIPKNSRSNRKWKN